MIIAKKNIYVLTKPIKEIVNNKKESIKYENQSKTLNKIEGRVYLLKKDSFSKITQFQCKNSITVVWHNHI